MNAYLIANELLSQNEAEGAVKIDRANGWLWLDREPGGAIALIRASARSHHCRLDMRAYGATVLPDGSLVSVMEWAIMPHFVTSEPELTKIKARFAEWLKLALQTKSAPASPPWWAFWRRRL